MTKSASNGLLFGKVMSSDVAMNSVNRKSMEEVADMSPAMPEMENAVSAGEQGSTVPVFRENFSETAFYYPRLHTDTAGVVTI